MGGLCKKRKEEMMAIKVASVVLALAVLAGAAPIAEKSLFEQQTEMYNSMLVQMREDPLEGPTVNIDADLKAKVIKEGEAAQAPEEWVDEAVAPELDDDEDAPATQTDANGVQHDAEWHEAATSLARNCQQLKVFGYASVDYREDLKAPNAALGVINDLFHAISPGMYNETNETPDACVSEYNSFVLSIKNDCDEVESIPCKMVTAIQENMQKDGLLMKYTDNDDHGKKKVSVDGAKVGLADTEALWDVKIGVTDSEIHATLRDMKDEYAHAMMQVPVSPVSGPTFTPDEVHTYDTWNGK